MGNLFGFDGVLIALRKGLKLRSMDWNRKDMFIELQTPDENSKMTYPYIFLNIPDGKGGFDKVPWIASQSDLLGENWDLYEEVVKGEASTEMSKKPVPADEEDQSDNQNDN